MRRGKKNPPPSFLGEGHHQNTLHLSWSSRLKKAGTILFSSNIKSHKYRKPFALNSKFIAGKITHFFI